MPELPEVEVLVRYLDPLLRNRRIEQVRVLRDRVIRPTKEASLKRQLKGATFRRVSRRAKFIVFNLVSKTGAECVVLGHLGMTGRMYVQPRSAALPKHAAVVLDLGEHKFVFEDTRYFGRFTLYRSALQGLGPEPLSEDFCAEEFGRALARSNQAIKVKLLDQRVVAGIGNIYASEALFRAGISPRKAAKRLKGPEIVQLCAAIREVLTEAIHFGSTVGLNFSGETRSKGEQNRLFYYGESDHLGAGQGTPANYEERLLVYDREAGQCVKCNGPIRRIVQAARSTFFCPKCQTA